MSLARRGAWALVASLLALANVASAADKKDSTEVFLYVWGTALAGDIDTPEGKSSFDIPFHDVWDNLNFAVMGRMRSQFDKFAIVADLFYADLESDREHQTIRLGPRGRIEVPVSAKVEATQWIGELSMGYEIFALDDVVLKPKGELYAGGRFWDISPKLDYRVANTSGDIDTSKGWVDPIVGARFALALSKTVEMGIQGDVGGFGWANSAQLDYAQMTTLSWRFADHWRMHLGYKFQGFVRDDGDSKLRFQLRGPVVAVSAPF